AVGISATGVSATQRRQRRRPPARLAAREAPMPTPERTAYVTGGASGIGLAIARALLVQGWRVAICGRDPARLEQAARELASERLLATRADVSEEEDVRRWVAEARGGLGPPDVLVNNAGIYEEYP